MSDNTGQELEPAAEVVEVAEVLPTAVGNTAADKLRSTLREMSEVDESTGPLGLTLASVAMGLEQNLDTELDGWQESGELDAFMLALTRFLATHRSERAGRLVVVELPRRRNLPAGTRLHALDAAELAADAATSPL